LAADVKALRYELGEFAIRAIARVKRRTQHYKHINAAFLINLVRRFFVKTSSLRRNSFINNWESYPTNTYIYGLFVMLDYLSKLIKILFSYLKRSRLIKFAAKPPPKVVFLILK
jgi:hypothetical protein